MAIIFKGLIINLLIIIIRYILFAGVVFWVFFIKLKSKFNSYFILKKYPAISQIKSEIGNSLLTMIVFSILSTFIPFTHLSYNHRISVVIFHFVMMVIVHDAYFYWTHRVMHHKYIYNLIHKTHHKSIYINPFSSYSFDLGEALINGLFLTIYLNTIFVPLQSVIIFILFTFAVNVHSHLGFEFLPSWWARLNITCTSTHHFLHHRYSNCNYGFYFPWWDKLMNTEHPNYKKIFIQNSNKK
jgi:Delta7-sterol 5-desaturase